jgi:hypothetical protein
VPAADSESRLIACAWSDATQEQQLRGGAYGMPHMVHPSQAAISDGLSRRRSLLSAANDFRDRLQLRSERIEVRARRGQANLRKLLAVQLPISD